VNIHTKYFKETFVINFSSLKTSEHKEHLEKALLRETFCQPFIRFTISLKVKFRARKEMNNGKGCKRNIIASFLQL